jgi:hypothetical protein
MIPKDEGDNNEQEEDEPDHPIVRITIFSTFALSSCK